MSVIAATLVGAYLWQSNYSTFALKLAGARSGMAATLPSYIPSGWKVDNTIKSSEGTLSYKIASRDHSLDVTQKKSDWDSQAVLEQFVLPRSTDYLALQAQGLTIYVRDGEVVLGKDGKTPLSPMEWAETLRENAAHLWPKAQGAGATGSVNGGGGGRTMKREAFDALRPADRAKKMAEGVTLIE
jgi:hypothetical protein